MTQSHLIMRYLMKISRYVNRRMSNSTHKSYKNVVNLSLKIYFVSLQFTGEPIAGENAPLGCPWTDPMVMDFLQHLEDESRAHDKVLTLSFDIYIIRLFFNRTMDFSSLLGPLFCTWVILQLFPVSNFFISSYLDLSANKMRFF